jgi:hypothetical protein
MLFQPMINKSRDERRTQGVNKMKKLTNIILVLMLMASTMSFALVIKADESTQQTPLENPMEDETEHEIQVMNNSIGSRIRLLQLEKALIKNILKGNMTIQIIKDLNVNTTKLEAILDNLTGVLDDVRAADPEANDSVEVFVELKNESRNLTKQFRDAVQILLDEETVSQIRERLRNVTNDELQNCSMRIQHWIRHFNRNQLYRLFGLTGEVNTSLLDDYLNGNVTLDQARQHFYKLVNQMTKEKRYMIFYEIKEENLKNKIHAHEALEQIQNHGNGKGHGGRP